MKSVLFELKYRLVVCCTWRIFFAIYFLLQNSKFISVVVLLRVKLKNLISVYFQMQIGWLVTLLLCCTTVQLYVLMEYCRHGCLRDYLVNKRHDFQDTMDVAEKPAVWFKRPKLVSFQSPLDFDDADDHRVLTTKDLVCYAFQIARGMHFLASQKVYIFSRAVINFNFVFLRLS